MIQTLLNTNPFFQFQTHTAIPYQWISLFPALENRSLLDSGGGNRNAAMWGCIESVKYAIWNIWKLKFYMLSKWYKLLLQRLTVSLYITSRVSRCCNQAQYTERERERTTDVLIFMLIKLTKKPVNLFVWIFCMGTLYHVLWKARINCHNENLQENRTFITSLRRAGNQNLPQLMTAALEAKERKQTMMDNLPWPCDRIAMMTTTTMHLTDPLLVSGRHTGYHPCALV